MPDPDALLTDEDRATLRHIALRGIGDNSLRALRSDLTYLEAWAWAATGMALPWPAPEALLLKFIAHHLYDDSAHAADPDGHGMPVAVEAQLRTAGLIKKTGAQAPATVKRRLSSWATLTRWRGLQGAFAAPGLRAALRLAVRASTRPATRKSEKAITLPVLNEMLNTCASGRLIDLRDRALLLLAFASGGRRRSEVAALRLEQITSLQHVDSDAASSDDTPATVLQIRLGRTKTTLADQAAAVLLTGSAVTALQTWLERAGITEGPVFRAVNQWGQLGKTALNPDSVNQIVKDRAAAAGLNPAQQRPRITRRISDGSGKARCSPARSHAAVDAPLAKPGGPLL
jgi:site-specific recombinase XerC